MRDMSVVRINLSRPQCELLREVLVKRAPEHLSILSSSTLVIVNVSQRKAIQELIGDELQESGFGAQSEINSRGLKLEALIDAFSPYK